MEEKTANWLVFMIWIISTTGITFYAYSTGMPITLITLIPCPLIGGAVALGASHFIYAFVSTGKGGMSSGRHNDGNGGI